MSIEKTNQLKRESVSVDLLIPSQWNPNEMSDKEFNLLYDNIEQMGITDPLLVRALDDGTYRLVGGHHRLEAAKLIGYTEVPVTIIDDDDFTEDQEKFQIVRHNVIHGKMSPQKFMEMYESLNEKYAEDVMADAFGFAEEEEFKKLIKQTEKDLPKEMKGKFKEAMKDVKTIDGLIAVLNKLFASHGDTLPYGYMIVEFGGKDSIWLRMETAARKNFLDIAEICKKRQITVDGYMSVVLHLSASGDFSKEALEVGLAALPKVELPESVEMPTLDYLDTL